MTTEAPQLAIKSEPASANPSNIAEESKKWDALVIASRDLCRKNYELNGSKIKGDIDVAFVVEYNENYVLRADFTLIAADETETQAEIYVVAFPERSKPELTSYDSLGDAVSAFVRLIEKEESDSKRRHREFFTDKFLTHVGVPGALAILSLLFAVMIELVSTTPNELWTLCVAAFSFYFGSRRSDQQER